MCSLLFRRRLYLSDIQPFGNISLKFSLISLCFCNFHLDEVVLSVAIPKFTLTVLSNGTVLVGSVLLFQYQVEMDCFKPRFEIFNISWRGMCNICILVNIFSVLAAPVRIIKPDWDKHPCCRKCQGCTREHTCVICGSWSDLLWAKQDKNMENKRKRAMAKERKFYSSILSEKKAKSRL